MTPDTINCSHENLFKTITTGLISAYSIALQQPISIEFSAIDMQNGFYKTPFPKKEYLAYFRLIDEFPLHLKTQAEI